MTLPTVDRVQDLGHSIASYAQTTLGYDLAKLQQTVLHPEDDTVEYYIKVDDKFQSNLSYFDYYQYPMIYIRVPAEDIGAAWSAIMAKPNRAMRELHIAANFAEKLGHSSEHFQTSELLEGAKRWIKAVDQQKEAMLTHQPETPKEQPAPDFEF